MLPRFSSNIPKQLLADSDGIFCGFCGVNGQSAEGNCSHVGVGKSFEQVERFGCLLMMSENTSSSNLPNSNLCAEGRKRGGCWSWMVGYRIKYLGFDFGENRTTRIGRRPLLLLRRCLLY